MHEFYIILVEVAYNVLNRKDVDNFSFINFIYVIKVYFILTYFVSTYIFYYSLYYFVSNYLFILFYDNYFAIKVCNKKVVYENSFCF